MIKTEQQYKKAIKTHRIISSLVVLTLASGVTVAGILANKYSKDYATLENSQEYIDYYEQTQQELLESGEITENEYQKNIEKGPDTNNYSSYVYKAGTKEEVDKYYNLRKNYIFSFSGALLGGMLIPIYLFWSSFGKRDIIEDYKKNKEKIELLDNDEKNQL